MLICNYSLFENGLITFGQKASSKRFRKLLIPDEICR
jgi:hypothetical protein